MSLGVFKKVIAGDDWSRGGSRTTAGLLSTRRLVMGKVGHPLTSNAVLLSECGVANGGVH